nr:hypothetical protein [Tanacetum cinerariifolium]
MTGNISYLFEYEPYDGGYVSFGQGGGKITGKEKDFKLKDDTNVLLRTSRQHNMYSIDFNNVVPHKNLTCLIAKAFVDKKHNIDFYQIVAFIEVSHIRRHLKLNDVEGISSLPNTEGEGLTIPSESHHTPSSQEQHLLHHDTISPLHPTITAEPVPPTPIETPTETPTLRQYSRSATRIAQSKAFSPAVDEPASLLRDDSQGEAFLTVSSLDRKGRACLRGCFNQRGVMEIREEVRVERSTELGSNDTEEMVNVLSAMEAANILTSGVAAISVSPVAAATTVGVPTISGLVPNVSVIFTTTSVVTPYSRRPREISAKDKGKEKVVEYDLARDSEIARHHAKEELKMMIEGLDRSHEMIAKHLHEYEQRKPLSKKEQREFYMSVLRSHAGWKTKHFRGMTLEEIKKKFIPVWKQIEDFVPMSLKEEVMKIPLLEYFATVSAKEFPLLSFSVAPAEEFALLDKDKDYSQSKTHYSQSKTCVSYSWNVSFN